MTGERFDVAVIGGGIAGCASAFELARRGLKVALFEKGRIAGEQSGRNWGFVRQQGRDPFEIPLMMACNRIWRDLEATLEADVEWRRLGVLYLAEDAAEMARYEAWLDQARPHQLDSRLLGPGEVEALVPSMARAWAGGLYTPSDGQADPVKATTAFARAAERHGATIRTGCIVERIETADGRVVGLRSERGAAAADAVVVAAGAWTSVLLRRLGLNCRSSPYGRASYAPPARRSCRCPEPARRISAFASAATARSTSPTAAAAITRSASTACVISAPSGRLTSATAPRSSCASAAGCSTTSRRRWAARQACGAGSPPNGCSIRHRTRGASTRRWRDSTRCFRAMPGSACRRPGPA